MVVTQSNSPCQQVPSTPNISHNQISSLASPLNAVVPQISQQQYLRPSPLIEFMTQNIVFTPKTPCRWYINMKEFLWNPVMTPALKYSPKSDQVVPETELKQEAVVSLANGNKELDESTDLQVVEDSDSATAAVDILDFIDGEYTEAKDPDIFQCFFAKDDDIFG